MGNMNVGQLSAVRSGFSSVSSTDLADLHAHITENVLPKSSLFLRERLDPYLVEYREEEEGYFQIPLSKVDLSNNNPQVQYLIEISTKSFPEFVTELTGAPFDECIPASQCEFRFLDKSRYNSILRLSSDIIKQISENMIKSKLCCAAHNISNFYTEFYLNNTSVAKKSLSCGVIQIVCIFDISYRD